MSIKWNFCTHTYLVTYTVLRCQKSRGGDGLGVSLIANGFRPPLDQKPLTDEEGGSNFYYPFRLAVVLLCLGYIHVFIFQFWISKKYTFYSQIISNKKHFIIFFFTTAYKLYGLYIYWIFNVNFFLGSWVMILVYLQVLT